MEAGSVYEFLAEAYLAKGDKAAAIDELERYVHKRRAQSRDHQAAGRQLLTDAGNKKEAAAVLDRLNFIYPMDPELHQRLGALWLDEGNAAGAIREFRRRGGASPASTPPQAHYDLARAYHLNHQTDEAQDELLAALEAAPGLPARRRSFCWN